MDGAGPDDSAADSGDSTRGGGLSILDGAFWVEIECSCASAFGWTRDTIYDTLDLPTYYRYCKWWKDHPPLYTMPRMLMGLAEGLSGASRARKGDPAAARGPRPPEPTPTDREDGGSAGLFAVDFTGTFPGQASTRRVKTTYYEDTLRDMDRERTLYLKMVGDPDDG